MTCRRVNRGLVVVGIIVAPLLWMRLHDRGRISKEQDAREMSDRARRVLINPVDGLRYFEGTNSIAFVVEMGSDRQGSFYYVYVPGPVRWRRSMPEWCRDRRDDVLGEITRLTQKRYRLKWVEDG
jgi:hypothetical protein